MAKPNGKVKKAFALSSMAGAIVMSASSGSPKLLALSKQVNDAMRVFNIKSAKDYYTISHDVRELWVEMEKRRKNALYPAEIEVFIEMVLSLLPSSDMKTYLGYKFTTKEKLRDSKKSALLVTVLELDEELNKMFGTKPTATRESIAKVMVKPVKAKTAKKERDKAVPRKTKKLRKRLEWHKQRRVAV